MGNCPENSRVIVDESMQPWVGPHWRNDSLPTQRSWIRDMFLERGTHVFLVHSWTKIWSCTGIRIGSVVAPSAGNLKRIRKKQVPWSVNSGALAFLSEVVRDTDYMERTWSLTETWRSHAVTKIG